MEGFHVGERIVLMDEDASKTPLAQSSELLTPMSGKYLMWCPPSGRITREGSKKTEKKRLAAASKQATMGRVGLYRDSEE